MTEVTNRTQSTHDDCRGESMRSYKKSTFGVESITGHRRFELLVNAVNDYAIYLLDADGVVSSWNTGAQRFKGYAAEEIIGRHFSCFYTLEDSAAGIPAFALYSAATTGKFESEGWRVRRDGTRFWASVVIDPVRDEAGDIMGFAKITRDMTERKRAQDEVDRARESLHQAQKIEALGRLTGGVAHDFNNLLTVVRSSADLLQRGELTEARRARYVRAIYDSADKAAKLTAQLLAFARQQPLDPHAFDVTARLLKLQPVIETSLGATIGLTFDFETQPIGVHADPTQFETAILNLVVNARDAMPHGGELRIRVRRCVQGIPGMPAKAHAESVCIDVTDTGHGIGPAEMGRIFDPFFTTKPVNKGTGLGLSQVYGFAKQAGGDVSVESVVSQGTTFSLRLPASTCLEVAVDAGTAALGTAPHHHILLVEDNDLVGQFAVDVLTDLKQNVVWAVSATEALDILESRRTEFDLVFTDVVMPGMNGIELARDIVHRWPDLPVVLTSGYNEVIEADAVLDFPLLRKPYSLEALSAMLANHGRLVGSQQPGHGGGGVQPDDSSPGGL